MQAAFSMNGIKPMTIQNRSTNNIGQKQSVMSA